MRSSSGHSGPGNNSIFQTICMSGLTKNAGIYGNVERQSWGFVKKSWIQCNPCVYCNIYIYIYILYTYIYIHIYICVCVCVVPCLVFAAPPYGGLLPHPPPPTPPTPYTYIYTMYTFAHTHMAHMAIQMRKSNLCVSENGFISYVPPKWLFQEKWWLSSGFGTRIRYSSNRKWYQCTQLLLILSIWESIILIHSHVSACKGLRMCACATFLCNLLAGMYMNVR